MERFTTLQTYEDEHGTVAEDSPSLLVVVIDTNPVAWQSLSNILPVNQALADILVFVNAHLALNNENQAAVIASHTNSAKFLYPRPTEQKPGSSITTDRRDPLREANAYRPFRVVEDLVIENFKLLLKNTSISGISHKSSSMMSGAIALALGYINRAIIDVGEEAKMKARILVVSASGDLAFQYIPMMNCIFSAQKKRVPIDICKIGGDAIFLQQASDATKGLYVNVEHPKGLLQYLLMLFLPDQEVRKHLTQPSQANVDFRAACFCHKKILNIGFVCSVCLSIFCQPYPKCLTCDTEFDVKNMDAMGGRPMVALKPKKTKQ